MSTNTLDKDPLDFASTHVKWKELACHDGTPYPDKWIVPRLYPLLEAFEVIRGKWGGPLKILSAYRTLAWNLRVGGANHSQHVEGRALDIAPLEGFHKDSQDFHAFVRDAIKLTPQIKGLGCYPWGCHIDTRPFSRLVTW
jgi:uncharacterized protein YcbK (DUF882 family)